MKHEKGGWGLLSERGYKTMARVVLVREIGVFISWKGWEREMLVIEYSSGLSAQERLLTLSYANFWLLGSAEGFCVGLLLGKFS